MKLPRLLQFVIVGALCGLGGYWSGHHRSAGVAQVDENSDPSPGSSKHHRGIRTSGAPAGLVSPGLGKLLEGRSLTKASAYEVTRQMLTETHPARRFAALGVLVDAMTPETASAIRRAFIDNTIETGRRNNEAWNLMVRKFGETLGPAALEEIKNNPGESATAFEGWAMADPDAALANLRSMDRSDQAYADRSAALLTGIAKIDPTKSFQIILSNPEMTVNSQTLVTSAVQSVGMDGLARSLQTAIDQASPEATQSPAFRAIFREIANTMFHQNWTGGRSETMLPWLEQQKGYSFVTNDIVNHAAKDVALQGNLTLALDWMDRMNEGKDAANATRGGIRSAVMEQPALLAKVDDATLDRVIAQFPPNSPDLKILAERIATLKPAHADRLRNAGQ